MELFEVVVETPPESIRALTDCLDRDGHDVQDGLYLLADYDIIHFEENSSTQKPYIPYDTVRSEVEFGLSRNEESESAASA